MIHSRSHIQINTHLYISYYQIDKCNLILQLILNLLMVHQLCSYIYQQMLIKSRRIIQNSLINSK
jgi:hypothetical protein